MHRNPSDRERSPANQAWRLLVAAFVGIVFAGHGIAQAPASDTGAAPPALSAEDLDALVGRIALYPDDLVAIILPALDLSAADRAGGPLSRQAQERSQAADRRQVGRLGEVARQLSRRRQEDERGSRLDSALGEAVVADQGAVLEAIQAFRRKAQAAGNLKSDDKQIVVVEKEVIKIVPADPQVIYVPQYNPTTVVVACSAGLRLLSDAVSVYYYPYRTGRSVRHRIDLGRRDRRGLGRRPLGHQLGRRRHQHQPQHEHQQRRHQSRQRQSPQRSGRRKAAATAWKSDKRPGQVSGATGRTSTTGRVGDAVAVARAAAGGIRRRRRRRPSASTGSRWRRGRQSSSTRQAVVRRRRWRGEPAGSVSASPRDNFGGRRRGGGGGDAFGGYGSGRQTQHGQLARRLEPQVDVESRRSAAVAAVAAAVAGVAAVVAAWRRRAAG